jgi:hypothetical protein
MLVNNAAILRTGVIEETRWPEGQLLMSVI